MFCLVLQSETPKNLRQPVRNQVHHRCSQNRQDFCDVIYTGVGRGLY
jgi:hypothetical protein